MAGSQSLIDQADGSSLLDPRAAPGSTVGAVYLMRHGHTVLDVDKRSDGFLDFPLSDDGRMGLIPAQQCLKTVPLVCIYAATLKRAVETAEIIKSGTASDPKIEKSDDARTWNLGILAGTRKRYGRPEVQKLIDNPDRAPMGGESFNDFRDRFCPWFDEVTAEASRAKPVLYVGSGSNLRLIGQELLGDPDMLDLDEGGLAVLHKSGGSWHVEVILGEDDTQTEIS